CGDVLREVAEERPVMQSVATQLHHNSSAHDEYAEFSWTYAAVKSFVITTASLWPACRSTTMATARADISTFSRSSPMPSSRQTQMLFIATDTRSGSKSAEVTPTALKTRPQFGSSP